MCVGGVLAGWRCKTVPTKSRDKQVNDRSELMISIPTSSLSQVETEVAYAGSCKWQNTDQNPGLQCPRTTPCPGHLRFQKDLWDFFTEPMTSLFWEEKSQSVSETQVTLSVEIGEGHSPSGDLGFLKDGTWGLDRGQIWNSELVFGANLLLQSLWTVCPLSLLSFWDRSLNHLLHFTQHRTSLEPGHPH